MQHLSTVICAGGTPMRIEPKTFFANERTFLSWLHMAVTIGSIAAALLGFSGSDKGAGLGAHLVEIIALILLPVAVAMCGYAIFIFTWRGQMIAKKRVSHSSGAARLAVVASCTSCLKCLDGLAARVLRVVLVLRDHGCFMPLTCM